MIQYKLLQPKYAVVPQLIFGIDSFSLIKQLSCFWYNRDMAVAHAAEQVAPHEPGMAGPRLGSKCEGVGVATKRYS